MYLTIDELKVDKTFKNRAKSKTPWGKILAVKVSKNLSRLLKLENPDLKKAKNISKKLALLQQNLIAIILLRK